MLCCLLSWMTGDIRGSSSEDQSKHERRAKVSSLRGQGTRREREEAGAFLLALSGCSRAKADRGAGDRRLTELPVGGAVEFVRVVGGPSTCVQLQF